MVMVFVPLAAFNALAVDGSASSVVQAVAEVHPSGPALHERKKSGEPCECSRRGLCNSQQPLGLGFVCAFAYGLRLDGAWKIPLSMLKLASHIPDLDPPPPRA